MRTLAIVIAACVTLVACREPRKLDGDCDLAVRKAAELQLEYLPPEVRREELKLVEPEVRGAIERCRALGLSRAKERCIAQAPSFGALADCDNGG
jgi:hypothetical protein